MDGFLFLAILAVIVLGWTSATNTHDGKNFVCNLCNLPSYDWCTNSFAECSGSIAGVAHKPDGGYLVLPNEICDRFGAESDDIPK